ncbi:MAG: hypothetical protein LBI92_05555 [Azoarcus sp.]|jgi:hypothetical protein|nr:hypothetical protein [Azoarcus sp.]
MSAMRRAGAVAKQVMADVAANLSGEPDVSTAVLWGSRSGVGEAGQRVVTDVVLKCEPPFPFDFLATQPNLVAISVRQAFACVDNVIHLPCAGEAELHWRRMETLAAAWLRARRYARVLCGQVGAEAGAEVGGHTARWRVFR